MKKKYLLCIFLLALLFVPLTSAFEVKDLLTLKFYTTPLKGLLDDLEKIGGFKEPEAGDTFFWISIPSVSGFSDFIGHLFIGIIAGLFLYIINIVMLAYNSYIENPPKARRKLRDPFKDVKTRWLDMISGKLWKVGVIMGFGYALLTQIPLINRIVQIITLDLFLESTSIFKKAFFVALIAGILPSLAEYFIRMRLEIKYQRMVDHAGKVGAKA